MGGLKKGCFLSDIGDGKSHLKDHIFYKLDKSAEEWVASDELMDLLFIIY